MTCFSILYADANARFGIGIATGEWRRCSFDVVAAFDEAVQRESHHAGIKTSHSHHRFGHAWQILVFLNFVQVA